MRISHTARAVLKPGLPTVELLSFLFSFSCTHISFESDCKILIFGSGFLNDQWCAFLKCTSIQRKQNRWEVRFNILYHVFKALGTLFLGLACLFSRWKCMKTLSGIQTSCRLMTRTVGRLKHCIWFAVCRGADAGAEEGSRRGRQRWFLSQRTGTAFTLKFTFPFLIASGHHTFIKDSWPVCAPPLSRIPAGAPSDL